jgi:hypothetical protein
VQAVKMSVLEIIHYVDTRRNETESECSGQRKPEIMKVENVSRKERGYKEEKIFHPVLYP